MNKSVEWAKALIGDDSINAAAKRCDVYQATLNRQIASGKLSAEMGIALARGYKVSAILSLVKAGFLSQADVETLAVDSQLSQASDEVLVAEIARRIAGIEPGKVSVYDQPLQIVVNEDDEPTPPTEEEALRMAASPHKPEEIPYAE